MSLSCLSWRPSLLGWRPSLVAWGPSLLVFLSCLRNGLQNGPFGPDSGSFGLELVALWYCSMTPLPRSNSWRKSRSSSSHGERASSTASSPSQDGIRGGWRSLLTQNNSLFNCYPPALAALDSCRLEKNQSSP